jgi:hypothetical protein
MRARAVKAAHPNSRGESLDTDGDPHFERKTGLGLANRNARGRDRLDSEFLSQVSVGQGRPRVSAAFSKMRPSEAEPLAGLRRSLART